VFARREIVADRQHHDLVDPIGLGERGEFYRNLLRGADDLAAAMIFDLAPCGAGTRVLKIRLPGDRRDPFIIHSVGRSVDPGLCRDDR
jgi:hypothetical protein